MHELKTNVHILTKYAPQFFKYCQNQSNQFAARQRDTHILCTLTHDAGVLYIL